MSARFMFADVVVVDGENIGCIVKSWHNEKRGYHYDVYVRMYNGIREYDEADICRYVVSKCISKEEKEWHP